jgi:hypothetical protein
VEITKTICETQEVHMDQGVRGFGGAKRRKDREKQK